MRRTAPLAALTARTAGEAVVVGLRKKLTGAESTEFQVRTAERYAELLGSSKGALMKAGQMLSFVSLGSAVDGEFQAIFQGAMTRLRNDAPPMAPPMAPELAREVLERELGRPAEEAFAEIDWEPLAAASIGQVHAARLHDGRAVAVKVQYPGVGDAIEADLKNTQLLGTFLGLMRGLSPRSPKLDIEGVSEEIGIRIREELDYRAEAANQTEFAEIYAGHPFIHVPAVVPEISTARVLTQELARGMSWSEALDAGDDLRADWAEAIYRFFYGSFVYNHLFNADPHPGNFLFHEDGSVTFLDFGCVKRLVPEEVESIDLVLRETLRGNVEETWRLSIELDFFDPSGSLTHEEVFAYWREPVELYWGEQPFTVTPDYVARLIETRYLPTGPSANAFHHITMPPAYTTLSRLDIGVMSLISRLRVAVPWAVVVAESIEGADPVTPMGKADRAWREGRGAVDGRA
ncbi:MAG TPA: AarF/ABC1/UbiB kinase family protein [Solirubrobacterales bacterium]|nr:AarF/ABC1/UbiB kinase family protein [Solirubrobacterales bacterium]